MKSNWINVDALMKSEGKVSWGSAKRKTVVKKLLKSLGDSKKSNLKFGFGGDYFAPSTLERILVVLMENDLVNRSCRNRLEHFCLENQTKLHNEFVLKKKKKKKELKNKTKNKI